MRSISKLQVEVKIALCTKCKFSVYIEYTAILAFTLQRSSYFGSMPEAYNYSYAVSCYTLHTLLLPYLLLFQYTHLSCWSPRSTGKQCDDFSN